jgi:hypothetical protein
MGVAGEAPAAATGRLVGELKADGEDKGEDTFDKRLAVCNEVEVGRLIWKIDSDRAVFSRRFGRRTPVSPLGHQVSSADETRWGYHIVISRPL